MEVTIRVQHLAATKELRIGLMETLEDLKKRIEWLYSIPATQQSLMLNNRNISTSTKPLCDVGLEEGSTIIVKKIHKFSGAQKAADLSSIMKNPMVANMMKNPELVKGIEEMFPGLKEEMAENKTLSMMLNNGGLEEELEKMASNSDYMNTQLWNADIMIAKLANTPDGARMMRGMVNDMDAPLRAMQSHGPALKQGHRIEEKMTDSLPGSGKVNYLVEYRRQLAELKEIGFTNTKENIRVLMSVNGDLEQALNILAQAGTKASK